MALPKLKLKPVPPVRVVKSASELHQFIAADMKDIANGGTEWVRDTARTKDEEARRAGNPKVRLITVNGTIGKNAVSFKGFKPGSIETAHSSVKITYLGSELSDLANKVQPVLQKIIEETYPDSRTKRLARDWEWRVQYRATPGGKGRWSVPVGKKVPKNVGLYDVLWLMPLPNIPTDYAWFANYYAKKRFGYKYNITRKTIHAINATSGKVEKKKVSRMKKRMVGFAGESSRRMRGAKGPGLHVSAMMIQSPLLVRGSRAKWGMPVIRVSFSPTLHTAVTP